MRKPSPAVAIASVALFFSLAGTGLAASRYLITSTSQIKPSVLKTLEGKQGPAGAPGANGAPGAVGATGAAGAPGAAGASFTTADVVEVIGPPIDVDPSGGIGSSYAQCPSGDVVLGGGYSGPLFDTTLGYDYPIADGTAWDVIVDNASGIAESFTPYAVCAS
jgi:hypothetical protein